METKIKNNKNTYRTYSLLDYIMAAIEYGEIPITLSSFKEKMEFTPERYNELYHSGIFTVEELEKIPSILGSSVRFWTNIQNSYKARNGK